MVNCKGKKVLITGASRGLGRQLAADLHHAGADLMVVARSGGDLQTLERELDENRCPGEVRTLVCDVAAKGAAQHIVDTVQNAWGYVDALVNNAAIQGPIGLFWENDWQEWTQAINTDLLAPIALCHALLPSMLARRQGSVINLSGGGATGARPRFSAYGAAKTALVRLTETLARELEPYRIRVNAVAPGVMQTAMLQEIFKAGAERAGTEYENLARRKVGEDSSAKAAALITFLVSDASAGITGRLLSAVWDPLDKILEHLSEVQNSDVYTLRRIVPEDRGMNW